MRRVLLINGMCGVGKSRAAFAVSDRLQARHVPHVVVDLDGLAQVFPRPVDDPYANRIALSQLRALLAGWEERALIIARVIETADDLKALNRALAPCQITHVRLRADMAVVDDRLARRESGKDLEWHRARARVLDAVLGSGPSPDLDIDTTNLDPWQVADALLTATDWPDRKESA